jgi:hypothetical protein
MKRFSLSLLAVFAIALAGNAFAQEGDYNSTDPSAPTVQSPADQDPLNTPPDPYRETAVDPSGNPGSDLNADPTTDALDRDPSATNPSSAYPSGTNRNDPNDRSARENLPATASFLPLVLAVGLAALLASMVINVLRTRRAD